MHPEIETIMLLTLLLTNTVIKRHLNENNKLELDDGSVLSEVLERLEKKKIQNFRTDGTYNEFKMIVSVAFPPMVSCKHWKRNRGELEVSNLLTVSDESLALIVLENNHEEWIDLAMGKELDKKKRKTKYTHAGQRKDGTRKGWSLEGRKRFNMIFTAIKTKRDRAMSREREERLLKEWRKEDSKKKDSTDGTNQAVDKNNEEEQYVPMTDFDFD